MTGFANSPNLCQFRIAASPSRKCGPGSTDMAAVALSVRIKIKANLLMLEFVYVDYENTLALRIPGSEKRFSWL